MFVWSGSTLELSGYAEPRVDVTPYRAAKVGRTANRVECLATTQSEKQNLLFDLDIMPSNVTLDKIRLLIFKPKSRFSRRGQKFAAFSFWCRVSQRDRLAPISPDIKQVERAIKKPRLIVASDNVQGMRQPSKIEPFMSVIKATGGKNAFKTICGNLPFSY